MDSFGKELARALELYSTGRLGEAEVVARALHTGKNADFMVSGLLGEILLDKEEYLEALDYLTRAREGLVAYSRKTADAAALKLRCSDPDSFEFLRSHYYAILQKGKLASLAAGQCDACGDWQGFIAAENGWEDFRTWYQFMGAADCHAHNKRPEKAAQSYVLAHDAAPDSESAQNAAFEAAKAFARIGNSLLVLKWLKGCLLANGEYWLPRFEDESDFADLRKDRTFMAELAAILSKQGFPGINQKK